MPSLFRPPEPVLEIARRLEEGGYDAWCVGGAVRDAILGQAHLDWDIATSATPEQVRALFGRRRTVPVGVEFGTVGVLDPTGTLHEVTTFRRDIRTDGRHAEVEFGASLEEDLARRDFTINAIAYSPSRDEIRDPFDGRGDIAQRMVRAVGDPNARMQEDRLRALRAIRFAARFDFTIEPATLAAIERSAPHLVRLSAERVKQELEKTMDQVRRPAAALQLWKRTGALETLVPALASLSEDSIAALDYVAAPGPSRKPYRRLVRIALLFTELDPHHARDALAALRFSRAEMNRVVTWVESWRAVGRAMDDALTGEAGVRDATVRRWVASIGRLDIAPYMRIAFARWTARGGDGAVTPTSSVIRAIYRRMLRAALHDPVEIRDLAIDGDDVLEAGIPPGPHIGKILEALLASVLEDPARNTREWLLQETQRLYDNGDRQPIRHAGR